MNIQFAHTYVHSPEKVREIIDTAWSIALDAEADGRPVIATFEQACQLLGATATATLVEQKAPMILPDLNSIRPH